jgi:hypothetical protein
LVGEWFFLTIGGGIKYLNPYPTEPPVVLTDSREARHVQAEVLQMLPLLKFHKIFTLQVALLAAIDQ